MNPKARIITSQVPRAIFFHRLPVILQKLPEAKQRLLDIGKNGKVSELDHLSILALYFKQDALPRGSLGNGVPLCINKRRSVTTVLPYRLKLALRQYRAVGT